MWTSPPQAAGSDAHLIRFDAHRLGSDYSPAGAAAARAGATAADLLISGDAEGWPTGATPPPVPPPSPVRTAARVDLETRLYAVQRRRLEAAAAAVPLPPFQAAVRRSARGARNEGAVAATATHTPPPPVPGPTPPDLGAGGSSAQSRVVDMRPARASDGGFGRRSASASPASSPRCGTLAMTTTGDGVIDVHDLPLSPSDASRTGGGYVPKRTTVFGELRCALARAAAMEARAAAAEARERERSGDAKCGCGAAAPLVPFLTRAPQAGGA